MKPWLLAVFVGSALLPQRVKVYAEVQEVTQQAQGQLTPVGFILKDISSRLEILASRVDAVRRTVRSGFVFDEEDSLADGNAVGFRDTERIQARLRLAASHHLLGDHERALALAQEVLRHPHSFSRSQRHYALRIAFASEQSLGNHPLAARSCLQLLASYSGGEVLKSQENKQSVDEHWLLSCAFSIAKGAAQARKDTVKVTHEEVRIFAESALIRQANELSIPVSLLLASAYRSVGHAPEGLQFLAEKLQNTSPLSPWYARGLFSKALLLVELGKSAEALKTLRFLAGDAQVLKKDLGTVRVDKYTAVLAKSSLGRLFAMRGQFPAAEFYYRDALSFLPSLSEGKSPRVPHQNRFSQNPFLHPRDSVYPYQFAQAFPYELAAVLTEVGNHAEAMQYFAKSLQVELPDKGEKKIGNPVSFVTSFQFAKLLVKAEETRLEGKKRLLSLLGQAQVDLGVLDNLLRQNPKSTFEEHAQNLSAVVAIAESHGFSHPTLNVLARYDRIHRQLESQLATHESDLAQTLEPLAFEGETGIDARFQAQVEHIRVLQKDLYPVMAKLDQIAFEVWNQQTEQAKRGVWHRKDLLRRFDLMDDPLARLSAKAQKEQSFAAHKSNEQKLNILQSAQWENAAFLASTSFLSRELTQRRRDGKMVPSEEARSFDTDFYSLLKSHDALSEKHTQQLIEHRLHRLQTHDRFGESKRAHEQSQIFASSVQDLRKLHERMRRTSGGFTDDFFFASIDNSWKRLGEVSQALEALLVELVAKEQNDVSYLAGEVQGILRVTETTRARLDKFREKLKDDLAVKIPQSVNLLLPVVRHFHAEIHVALASGEAARMSELKVLESELEKAKEERLLWLKSLRRSLDWNLAR